MSRYKVSAHGRIYDDANPYMPVIGDIAQVKRRSLQRKVPHRHSEVRRVGMLPSRSAGRCDPAAAAGSDADKAHLHRDDDIR